ncbi:MAG TPA: hypothetical protein PLL86_23930, partial [Leptospiraceae bacterium]|nr:hypothetical protein [Leptospiraceae bacterium]
DVFALYKLDGKTEGDALEPVSLEGTFLSQQAFVNPPTTFFAPLNDITFLVPYFNSIIVI